jgi:hypothetical protein
VHIKKIGMDFYLGVDDARHRRDGPDPGVSEAPYVERLKSGLDLSYGTGGQTTVTRWNL